MTINNMIDWFSYALQIKHCRGSLCRLNSCVSVSEIIAESVVGVNFMDCIS